LAGCPELPLEGSDLQRPSGGRLHLQEETEEPREPTCSLYASVEGSDANPGSLKYPLRTVKALIQDLEAGQTGCLTSGQTFSGSLTLSGGDSMGKAHKPITITSTNPANPATIYGRVVTESGADWLTFTGLEFRWNETVGIGLPQITVGSDHTAWTYDDVGNFNTTICFNTIMSSLYGTAHYTLIDHDRIHDCGGPVGYTSALSNGYHSHGVYATGYDTTITNNYIYHESGRGVQLRGSHSGVVEHNIIDDNGAGIVIGDLGASNNEIAYNIITSSSTSINRCCNVLGVYSWWGPESGGSGNTFHNNCLYANEEGNIDTSGGGFATFENRIANPQYVDATGRDYALQPTSPCLGYGPDTAQP
jgi:parallel beta-helix repeat protein